MPDPKPEITVVDGDKIALIEPYIETAVEAMTQDGFVDQEAQILIIPTSKVLSGDIPKNFKREKQFREFFEDVDHDEHATTKRIDKLLMFSPLCKTKCKINLNCISYLWLSC